MLNSQTPCKYLTALLSFKAFTGRNKWWGRFHATRHGYPPVQTSWRISGVLQENLLQKISCGVCPTAAFETKPRVVGLRVSRENSLLFRSGANLKWYCPYTKESVSRRKLCGFVDRVPSEFLRSLAVVLLSQLRHYKKRWGIIVDRKLPSCVFLHTQQVGKGNTLCFSCSDVFCA